ncbi:MAG: DUF2726 domain-containing protein [Clostridia bacterium]|nr:DUF2726 domain-containing protein [Clostridia bacterium]
MKCKVCGSESGKYPLCRSCNIKKESGAIIKCNKCGNWHYASDDCVRESAKTDNDSYLYDVRNILISKSEQNFYQAIKFALPEGHYVFPQINLATFIERTDDARFHNELFRNVDFLVTNDKYRPLFIIEINDQTHYNSERKERDEKVRKICEEAGIPILKLWTSYGANEEYIKKRIDDILSSFPVPRVHHFSQANEETPQTEVAAPNNTNNTNPIYTGPVSTNSRSYKRKGCYVATCVYGSYDCPPVWTLRRYRDNTLAKTWYGRAFIRTYYAISPMIVKWFGNTNWFKALLEKPLNSFVNKLQNNGVENTPYDDVAW